MSAAMNGEAARLGRVASLLREGIERGLFPGAVAMVTRSGEAVFNEAVGQAAVRPVPRAMTLETVFDLASLTKPVATTTAVMLLVEDGRLRLDDPARLFVPGFEARGKESVTVRHLLTHTSGLPAWEDLRPFTGDRPAALRHIAGLEVRWPPGTRVEYSDLGFLTLQAVVEERAGRPLDHFCAERVFEPLGMTRTRFNPPAEWRPFTAATEYRAERGEYDWGTVHDENARALGGVCGHAGLFSSAADLTVFARMLLDGGTYGGRRILSPATIRTMTTNQTPGLNEARTLGWSARSAPGPGTLAGPPSSGGDLLSPSAFGHTGFTGTSLWIDPQAGLTCVLLTNRVHLGRETTGGIIRFRGLFHNAVAAAVGTVARDSPPGREDR